MTVSTKDVTINERELSVVLCGLLLSKTPHMAAPIAADMMRCVADLRERARTGNLEDYETKLLRGESP